MPENTSSKLIAEYNDVFNKLICDSMSDQHRDLPQSLLGDIIRVKGMLLMSSNLGANSLFCPIEGKSVESTKRIVAALSRKDEGPVIVSANQRGRFKRLIYIPSILTGIAIAQIESIENGSENITNYFFISERPRIQSR